MRRTEEAAGAFTPIAIIFILGLVGGVIANLTIPLQVLPLWLQITGLAPLVIGVGLFIWARSAFSRHKTSLMPWSPTAELVHDGPYRYSRNPIYLAFGLIYLGIGLVFNSAYVLMMLVVVLVLFDRLQIPREEQYLENKFGESFKTYKSKVRRWI